ncbi:glycoside hydrolase family 3 N-terminal domain-containing protein [Rathayibacter oskolensis]|uniref:glycoside hydrolase family 3 N-terminal domain-containing protein n=1 Tax=Rathayibacter oskolensis TaxID=1891671 RepID=UPI00265D7C6E|nr:glycoside hydrolase family 3 N-terminal domain-containing protein [Rathayibacter oskolensis]WKK71269.1 glycoside hydrolase family 3 N-terminal domain-containing protein [Rathayibacter oskolensis]
MTLSTDPRHSFTDNPGTGAQAAAFSQWPEPLGLGAIGDEELVRRFGDIARREYLAVGLRVALHPQIDLATESRWARQVGTFGEDAELTGRLGAAYIRGFQGEVLGSESVATMTKHFPGGGPQKDGEDPHFAYGREQVYPGGNAEYHLRPFERAFEAGTSQIMPYYGMPVGTPFEEVGFGFNRSVITGLLRERFGFDGIVCTDWGLLSDAHIMGDLHPARAWGVEHLSVPERMRKAIEAESTSSAARRSPRCWSRWSRRGDQRGAARRLGAPAAAREVRAGAVRPAGGRPRGRGVRRRIGGVPGGGRGGSARGDHRAGARQRSPGAARAAAVRGGAGRGGGRVLRDGRRLTGGGRPRGDPAPGPVRAAGDGVRELLPRGVARLPCGGGGARRVGGGEGPHCRRRVPGPAGDPDAVRRDGRRALGDFGASGAALLDVVFGMSEARGRLPMDLPRSMAAAEARRPDVPFDTADPLFRFGHGLTL